MPKRKPVSTIDENDRRPKRAFIDTPTNQASTTNETNRPTGSRTRNTVLEIQEAGLQNGDGTAILVCGDGDAGQLGLGDNVLEKSTLKTVPAISGVYGIAGAMHSIIISSDRKMLISFGCSDNGILGRDTDTSVDVNALPENIPGRVNISVFDGVSVAMVSAGDSHSAALLTDGRVFIWGNFRNSHGILGLTKLDKIESTPVQVLGIKHPAVKVASGANHIAILDNLGTVYTFGSAEQGQLGRISKRSCDASSRTGLGRSLFPYPVSSKIKFDDVWAGGYTTFLKQRGSNKIYVCGLNNFNQLGIGSESSFDSCIFNITISPTLSENLWKKISPAEHHVILLSTNGQVHSLGRKEYGRLGLGALGDATKPTLIPDLANIVCSDIACGSATSFALTQDGKIYSWGMGSCQLGLGSEEDHPSPTLISRGEINKYSSVGVITAGSQHLLAICRP